MTVGNWLKGGLPPLKEVKGSSPASLEYGSVLIVNLSTQ